MEDEVIREIDVDTDAVERLGEELADERRLVDEEVPLNELAVEDVILVELVEEDRLVEEEVLLEELAMEDVILEELVEDDLAEADVIRAATIRMEGSNMMRDVREVVVWTIVKLGHVNPYICVILSSWTLHDFLELIL